MANLYSVELNFDTSIVLEVEANDEGEALAKARELAEMAPMSRFSITEEHNSRILNVQPLQRQ